MRIATKVFGPYRHRRKVTIFGSAQTPPDAPAYAQAVALGEAMADANWLVVAGAANGIMEAGHHGAGREHSMGLNIMLPFEQEANPVIAGDPKLVNMKYFFTRKVMFVKEVQTPWSACQADLGLWMRPWKCSLYCRPANVTSCP